MRGFVRRHAAGDVVVAFAGEVILELGGALVIPLRSAEEAEHAHLLSKRNGRGKPGRAAGREPGGSETHTPEGDRPERE
jgi:hypothetical protein